MNHRCNTLVVQERFCTIQLLGTPRAQRNAVHSCQAAAATKSDDAGLESVVFIAKGATVMLTSNLWQICNGSQ